MTKLSHRAARLAVVGAGMALLLAACGESVPEGEQQGSVSPPAAADQAAQATTEENAQTSQ